MKNFNSTVVKTVLLFVMLGVESNKIWAREDSDQLIKRVMLTPVNVNDSSLGLEDATLRIARYRRAVKGSNTGVYGPACRVLRVLEEKKLTIFIELLKETCLFEEINTMNSVTLFVPTDEALANPETADKLKELRKDKDKLRKVLLFHMAGIKLQKCNMVRDTKLMSRLAKNTLRLTKYYENWEPRVFTAATAECARILNFHEKACDGTVHEIDRLMLPPTGSVYDVIQSNESYSILREVLQGTGLEKELKTKSPITFLAPVNEAFTKLEYDELIMLKYNKNLAKIILGKHFIPENLCCAGVGKDSTWQNPKKLRSVFGDIVEVFRDYNDVVRTSAASVIGCDSMATNGIILTLNRIMVLRGEIAHWNLNLNETNTTDKNTFSLPN